MIGKQLVLAVFFSLYFLMGSAQTITGTITDKATQEPIPYATVILKNAQSEFLEGTTSNESGTFSIAYQDGEYLVEVSFIGYKRISDQVAIKGDTALNFELEAEISGLEEVVVTGEISTVQQMIDKKVINVGKDLQSGGGDALTVLEQLSEVQADQDGNVSLRGSQNVNVLLNGKPSPLSTAELLQQIPANEISKVELITSPSAKYQADGLTGIVNIITTKKVRKGITLSTNAAVNSLVGYNGGANLSYGQSKINYRIGASYRNSIFKNDNYQRRFGTQPFEREGDFKFNGTIYSFNGGIDWFPSDQDELSLTVDYTDNGHTLDSNANILQNAIQTDQRSIGEHSHKTLNANGNYRHLFKNKEDYIELDVQLSNNTNVLDGNFIPNLNVLDNGTDNDALISTAALDYAKLLNENLKLETGLFWNRQNLENSRTFFDNAGQAVSTDKFRNTQSTTAAYGLLKYEIKKLNVQLGLRGELFSRNADLITDGGTVGNDFNDLFPSVHSSYTFAEGRVLILGYNRRTSRPSLGQVNPIAFQVNEFSIFQGNPRLDPEFSNNFDFSYQFKEKTFDISPSFSYRLKKKSILQNNFVDENGVTVYTYDNNGNSNAYSMSLAINIKPTKWLKSTIDTNWNYEELRENVVGFTSGFSRSFNLTNRNNLTLSKTTSAVLTWRYNAPSQGFYYANRTTQKVDIALRQQLFGGKGNINLRVTDIFDTWVRGGTNSGIGFVQENRYKPFSRVAYLAFTYRFDDGMLKKRTKKEREYKSGIID